MKLSIGRRCVTWTKSKVKATFVNIEKIWRKKTSLQAFGNLICSHQAKVSFQYIDCPKNNCILFIIVQIVKRIISDLVDMALFKSNLKSPPERGNWKKGAKNYWKRQLSRYLLFVMQKTKLVQLKPENEDNILYQIGYNENISLSGILDVEEKYVLASLPYWLIIPRLTSEQLTMLAHKHKIEIPEKCTKTRAALVKIVMAAYDKWDKILNNKSITMVDLFTNFEHVQGFSVDLSKDDIKALINPIRHGDEVLLMWLTTDGEKFYPTLRRIPGPTINKEMVSKWLHACSLLHKRSKENPANTRIFSDTDCRTHCLHLRRDSGENVLMTCNQMGWKPPKEFSDSGSLVYRRANAIVTSQEYNSNFIQWLQLTFEGRITAKVGFDWQTVVENARIRYQQLNMKDIEKVQRSEQLKLIVESCCNEKFAKIESKIDESSTLIQDKFEKNFSTFKKDLIGAIMQIFKSSDDVGQRITSKIRNRGKKVPAAVKNSKIRNSKRKLVEMLKKSD